MSLGVFFDGNMGWLFWILSSIAALILIFSLICCGKNAKIVGASSAELVFAIIMQILATAGIVIFVILIFAALRDLDKKRKK